MRVTYTISVLIILLAMGVAYRYLPARAAEPIVLDENDSRPAPEVGEVVEDVVGEIDEPSGRTPAGDHR